MLKPGWPLSCRDWVTGLPEQLGPRKFRLLVHAVCRSLLEPAFEQAVARDEYLRHVQAGLLDALEVADRYADTGKSKSALKEMLKKLECLGDAQWPVPTGYPVMVMVLSEEPEQTLLQCGRAFQLATHRPIETFIAVLQALAADLTPPAGDVAAIDPACHSARVLELAQAIYQQRAFQRMPELADALASARCTNEEAINHCRAAGAVHVRGCWVLDALLGDQIARPKAARPPRGSQPRHEVLGVHLFATREVTLQCLAESTARHAERTAPGQPDQVFNRFMELEDTTAHAVLEHMGYGPIDGLADRLHRGVDRAVEYFFGDWCASAAPDARALDDPRPLREHNWLGPLRHGLLLAGLMGRWDDVVKLCSWVDERIQVEDRFELNEDEHQWLYYCIASELQPTPLEGAARVLAQLRQCRPKRLRLLTALWNAILAGNQAAYAAALKESVQHFLKQHADNAPNPNFWVALDESVLCLIAERRRLTFPALPEKADAAVVRRQTVGLTA